MSSLHLDPERRRQPKNVARMNCHDGWTSPKPSLGASRFVHFLPDPVSDDTIAESADRASRSPSGGNVQPWRIYVVNGESMTRFREFLSRPSAGSRRRTTSIRRSCPSRTARRGTRSAKTCMRRSASTETTRLADSRSSRRTSTSSVHRLRSSASSTGSWVHRSGAISACSCRRSCCSRRRRDSTRARRRRGRCTRRRSASSSVRRSEQRIFCGVASGRADWDAADQQRAERPRTPRRLRHVRLTYVRCVRHIASSAFGGDGQHGVGMGVDLLGGQLAAGQFDDERHGIAGLLQLVAGPRGSDAGVDAAAVAARGERAVRSARRSGRGSRPSRPVDGMMRLASW